MHTVRLRPWAIVLGVTGCLADETMPTGPEPTTARCALNAAPAPMRRLTRLEYAHAARDLFGARPELTSALLEDEATGGFTANTTAVVQALHIERYADAAQRVAAAVDLDTAAARCTSRDEDCLRTLRDGWARRAFRRPLMASEQEALASLYRADDDFETNARTVIQALLQAPSFLYRPEVGVDTASITDLTGYERASRLSFLLWASIPDEPLLQAAASGKLDSVDGLVDEANRMMASERHRDALDSFHGQWLKLDRLELATKADTTADWNTIKSSARTEALLFTRSLAQDGRSISEYFYSAQPFTFADDALGDVYGIDAATAHGRVDLPPNQRAGVLTQIAFLASNAKARSTSPVHRGLFVREQVLCGVLLPPPPNVDTSLPDPPPTVTMREQLEAHRSNPACRGCHEQSDPIGFAFEHYDAVGAYRTTEAGRPVDASGYIVGSKGSDAQFNDAIELSRHLAQSDEVAACLGEKWFAFTFARPPGRDETCALEASVTVDTTVRGLLLDFIRSAAFSRIRNDP